MAEERTNVISWNEREDEVEVEVFSRRWRNRLESLGFEGEEMDDGSVHYTIGTEYLQLPRNPRSRTLTEEQKEAGAERLREARERRQREAAKASKNGKKAPPPAAKQSQPKTTGKKQARPEPEPEEEEEVEYEEEEAEYEEDDEQVEVVSRKPAKQPAKPAPKQPTGKKPARK